MGCSEQICERVAIEPIQPHEDSRVVHIMIGDVVCFRRVLEESLTLIKVDAQCQRAMLRIFLQ